MEEKLNNDVFDCYNWSKTETTQECEQETLQETTQESEQEISKSQEERKAIGVFVKVNEDGFVTDVGSDVFIKDLDGWLKIDEGLGDKFAHAQSLYFDEPLINEKGEYTQKFKKEN